MNEQTNYPTAICYGEMLWDKFPDGDRPGGAPMNVAYHLTQMGVASSIISSIGNDADGFRLLQQLDRWGVGTGFCQLHKAYPTGQVLATINEKQEAHYEIMENVAWDFISVKAGAKAAVANSKALVYGSLAARSKVSRATLYELLEASLCNVFDINLRPPFYDAATLLHLLQAADIVKMNIAELNLVAELLGATHASEDDSALLVQQRFDIPELILTKGSKGASYYIDGHCYEVPALTINVKDTVGSGDAFLAGFLAKRLSDAPVDRMVQAASLAAFVTAREGACPQYQPQEFRHFIAQSTPDLLRGASVRKI